MAKLAASTSDWYHAPHDFDWIINHRSTRPLTGIIRVVFGTAVLMYALTSILMLSSDLGPSGTFEVGWVVFVLFTQALVAARCVLGPIPGKKFFIGFLAFGDILTTSVLVLYEPIASLIGTVLFAVTGAFCTYFLSPRLLVAHLVWTATFIIGFGIRVLVSVLDGDVGYIDAPSVVTATVVLLLATVGVPVFAQVAWTTLSNDAKRSVLDPLTGVFNRRGIDSELLDLWRHARKEGKSMAFVVVDIDKFKAVNDNFGHSRGDEVIIRVADRLRRLVRQEGGALARTGGEEFLVALVGDARRMVDLGLEMVQALCDQRDDIPVTVSVGMALLREDSALWDVGTSVVGRAVRTADTAMYRSKQSGGNRLIVDEI
ncbi:GGDEF domain-containing protein [Rhodococcus sp. KRD162]|uniref:GGDEF domain-containing protein n=1 Tax=unclassified Rhodococcus (in: high G+C Gram-positive bacteria) TaxID=192944 RepID=UPI0019D2B283|nr:GGDEF domain-containing protein [Rhodococcus sp. KRD162]